FHTHWDREWYQPFQEYRLRLIDTFDEIIENLQNGNLNQFYFDGQTIVIEDYLEIHPEKREIIKNLIKENKLKVGPWYALADEFLVNGESLIRNLLVGINQAKALGEKDFIGYLPDAFGHCASMPMIFNSFNIKNAVVWRGVGEQDSEFIWKSADNSSVIATYLTEGYFQDYLHGDNSIKEKAQNIKNLLDKIKKYSIGDLILLPVGADHLSLPENPNKITQQINEQIENYDIVSGSIFDYVNTEKKAKNEIMGELRDNSRSFILPGTLTSRIYLKRQNALATWKLSKLAEPFQAYMKNLNLSKSRKNELIHAWKLLLQNHPHDSICGCSRDEVHRQMLTRFDEVNQISDGIISRNLNILSKALSKGSFAVCNLSNFEFSGIVKIKTRQKLPDSLPRQFLKTLTEFPNEILQNLKRPPIREYVEKYDEYLIWADKIKPNSIKIINENFNNSIIPDNVEITNKSIKNSKIELKINYDGTIDIKDNETLKEFKGLHTIEDVADCGDSYNLCPIKDDIAIKADLAKTKIIEIGSLRSTLRLKYKIAIPQSLDNSQKFRSKKIVKHTINIDVSLCSNAKRVEFKAVWENNSLNHLLKIKFNTGQKVYKTLSEDNLGIIERKFNPDYEISQNIPVEKGKEVFENTAPMGRFVSANGLSIITEGLSEYGVSKNNLELTILRSTGIISNGTMDTRGLAAGPPIETPECQCLGFQQARYAICLNDKPQELFKEADEFMNCILFAEGISEKSQKLPINFLEIDNSNIYIYATKIPEKSTKGLIIRLMNISNTPQSTIISTEHFSKTVQTNSLEELIQKEQKLPVNINFEPNELKTFYLT
ncbi:MAG: glycoside hydrolase family 38 C-terminal domain-containing protein, partial [Candidatus Gastranaerophilales bacterium]|nr:glycoside hydrolase family 38 C-terminal domain-containing protein [Candidatus Gastranaerophilales bacterium]